MALPSHALRFQNEPQISHSDLSYYDHFTMCHHQQLTNHCRGQSNNAQIFEKTFCFFHVPINVRILQKLVCSVLDTVFPECVIRRLSSYTYAPHREAKSRLDFSLPSSRSTGPHHYIISSIFLVDDINLMMSLTNACTYCFSSIYIASPIRRF